MADQRLSKLQKWILTNCFKVTVLLDRTQLKKLKNYDCSMCDSLQYPGNISFERNMHNVILIKCNKKDKYCSYYDFYKEDVLLSYFNLIPNNEKEHIDRVQHFKQSDGFVKAHVTLHRSIKNLYAKDLISSSKAFTANSLELRLTENGIQVAAKLLGLCETDYFIPSLLTIEEQTEKRNEYINEYGQYP